MNTHIDTLGSFMKTITALIVTAILVIPLSASAGEMHWYKGNTHTHTTNSDGDASPREVVRYYSDHEYNFLFITDHNSLTEPKFLDTDGNKDNFIMIAGEEVTDWQNITLKPGVIKGVPIHVNGLGLTKKVETTFGEEVGVVKTMQKDIDNIRTAGGIAQINHPNYGWAFTDEEISQVHGATLLEILNMNKECNSVGGGGRKSAEQIWDGVLSKGVLLYGVNSDDAHHYLAGEQNADRFNPGRGWIMVRAPELTTEAIMGAISKGEFYTTTGIELVDVQVSKKSYTVEIKKLGETAYTTTFIGKDGKVLEESNDIKSTYTITGKEGYVRARISASTGDTAFTQPIMLK